MVPVPPTYDPRAHGWRAAVVVASDRALSGERPDASGPLAVEMLRGAGWETGAPVVVPDGVEPVAAALRTAIAAGVHVVITSGGTGVAPRDLTPEATRTVLDRELPGIAETLRRLGAEHKLTAVLTRGLAGVAGSTVVVNLPGSTGGVRDGLDYLLPLLPHVVEQLAGGDH